MNQPSPDTVVQAASLAPLFDPVRIGGLTLPNRFVMAPMTRSRSPGGVPGADVARYYRARAEGGVGLVITEGIAVPHAAAIGYSGVDVLDIPSLYGEDALAGWKHVVDEVHAAGGLIAPQLWHQGAMRLEGTGAFPAARSMRPSGIWGPRDRQKLVPDSYLSQIPAEVAPMSESEIADVIAAFATAAASAREIGFDAIAIHGAHGYLIDSFLWHETNRRTDGWGGVHRGRFAAEVVRAIRGAIGPDMPIIFRFSQWKLQDSGGAIAANPDALAELLGPIADAGADVFDASTRNFDLPAFAGSDRSLAGWARALTGVPSMVVGSIGLASAMFEEDAEGRSASSDNLARVAARFADGEFDLVGIGRMLIAQADWVERVRHGRPIDAYSRKMLAELR